MQSRIGAHSVATAFAALAVAALVPGPSSLTAQTGPAVVGVTAARSVTLRSKVELPATVEARVSAVVASRVAPHPSREFVASDLVTRL